MAYRWTEVCIPEIKYSCEQMLFKTDSLKKLISPHQRKVVSLETSLIYVQTLVWALKLKIDPDNKTASSFSRFIIFVLQVCKPPRNSNMRVLNYAIFDLVKTPYDGGCGTEAPPTTPTRPVF